MKKTKEFYGIKFKVYTDKKIEGDFIKPDEAVYFENNIEITGRLEVKCLKAEKSINVHKSYIVKEWEEVGGSQKVGRSQEIGWYQEIGWSQEVGGSQEVGWYQEVGGSQEVGEYQKVGGYITVGYSITTKGEITCGENYTITAGYAARKDDSEDRKIRAVKVNGTIALGEFEEIGPTKENRQEDKSSAKRRTNR